MKNVRSKQPKVCAVCGSTFYPWNNNPNQQYCSLKCAANRYRKRLEVVNGERPCQRCGRLFPVQPSHTNKRYCSWECRYPGASKYAKIVTPRQTCPVCKETFVPSKSKQIFCSVDCRRTDHRRKMQERNPRPAVQCSYCGAPMLVFPSKAKLNKHFYCSIECRALYITGKHNPSFRSGTGRKIEYGFNWRRQRKQAIARDGGKCQVCGKSPKYSRYLHVHHIIPAYTFAGDWQAANQLGNLICLCSTCHKKVEKGAVAIQPKLL